MLWASQAMIQSIPLAHSKNCRMGKCSTCRFTVYIWSLLEWKLHNCHSLLPTVNRWAWTYAMYLTSFLPRWSYRASYLFLHPEQALSFEAICTTVINMARKSLPRSKASWSISNGSHFMAFIACTKELYKIAAHRFFALLVMLYSSLESNWQMILWQQKMIS